jgi:hypothetical protein
MDKLLVLLEELNDRERYEYNQTGFFGNENLGKTISRLKRSTSTTAQIPDIFSNNPKVSAKMPIISITEGTHKPRRSSLIASTEQFCTNRSRNQHKRQTETSYTSTLFPFQETPKPKKAEKLDTETKFLYNKIFIRDNYTIEKAKLKYKGKQKQSTDPDVVRINQRRCNVENKMNVIRKKVMFIKGVYDYTYPHVILDKIRCVNNIGAPAMKASSNNLKVSNGNIQATNTVYNGSPKSKVKNSTKSLLSGAVTTVGSYRQLDK